MGKKLIIPLLSVIGIIIAAAIGYRGVINSTWIPIHATETAEARLTEVALLSTPTVTETPAVTATYTLVFTSALTYSDAIVVVNNYYSWINSAGNKDDLVRSWNLLTTGINGFQCQSESGCRLSSFQGYWWEHKAQYKLYDCGANVVIGELSYYSRSAKITPTPSSPVDVSKYQLVYENGQLKIDTVQPTEGPGANCQLAISVP